MRWLDRLKEVYQDHKPCNRCPNCDTPFSTNGEGSIDIRTYVASGAFDHAESLGLCLVCLDGCPSRIDKERIMVALKKQGWGFELIEDAMRGIDLYLQGKTSHDVWRESSG